RIALPYSLNVRVAWQPRNSCNSYKLRGHEPGRESRLQQGGRNPSFFKKVHKVNFFEKAYKEYHAAAGASGVRVWHQDGTSRTAYVL
ncbi:MAG: hypothetical protein ACLFVO_00380, partial [Chloroflexaceae bacterium]